MTWLETTLRVVGFVVAVLGSGAAVPAATWRMLNRVGRRVEGVVRRLLRRPRVVRLGTARVSASASSSWAVSGIARGEAPDGTVEERLDRLEQRVRQVDEDQQQTAAALARESAARASEHADLRGHVDREVARLHGRFEDEQRTTEEVDAAALPVVLVGAAVSTFPELLGANLVVGMLALIAGVAAGGRAFVLLARARPTEK